MTDMKVLKMLAIAYLDIEPEDTGVLDIVSHPFYEYKTMPMFEDGEMKMLSIFDPNERAEIREYYVNHIEKAESWVHLFMMMRKPYLLSFVSNAEEFMSKEDWSEALAYAWTTSENPNDDVNVPIEESIAMFRRAKKTSLMDEDEYKVYKDLPDTMTVYRGIANGHNPEGLSYTLDKKVAQWFADRFNGNGYIIEAEISKDAVLAYFSSRNEEEVVVDSSMIKKGGAKSE